MPLRYLVPILGLVLVLGALGGLKACQISRLVEAGKAAEQAGPPPETVSTTRAVRQTWEKILEAVGTVASARGVPVSSEVAGVVARLHFDSGQTVNKGALLIELDTSVERAQLSSTRAQRDGAETAVRRSRALAAEGVVARAQLDADEAAFKSLSAEVGALEAAIARKSVRAPFRGKLGIREVNLGQYLPPGTPVTVLEAMDAVYVDFTLPQGELDRLAVGLPVRATRDQEAHVYEGTISTIEPDVDPATRAVAVRASFEDRERLRPGMFLNTRVILPGADERVVIPVTAVQHASYGDSVFVVETAKPAKAGDPPRKIARQKFVRLGETRGDFVAVVSGLSAGEEVVSAGGFKLRNNSPVVVSDRVKLDFELDPQPENR